MKKYLSIIILLSLSLFLLSCESKEADYVEIIKMKITLFIKIYQII